MPSKEKLENIKTADFAAGRMPEKIIRQSIPLLIAQLVQLLYNIVDRIYIGHMERVGSLALSGVGLAFPLTTLVMAFTVLFGRGGMPVFSFSRGQGDEKQAEKIFNQTIGYLLISAAVLTVLCYCLRKPILYAVGGSDAIYVYADEYLKIYLAGTVFVMFATGMNGYIGAQGHPRIGMLATLLGAVVNIVLDPLFIFTFGMGVSGAALATVISQIVSAGATLAFFRGSKSICRIRPKDMIPDLSVGLQILRYGITDFIMQGTNFFVQICSNIMLRQYGDMMPIANGGDVYVGVMTILNSLRELFMLPVVSLGQGAKPVLGFNYGARKYRRVRQGLRFMAVLMLAVLIILWVPVIARPDLCIRLFTSDEVIVTAAVPALRIYFSTYVLIGLMGIGQNGFTALKCPKRAMFFSLMRKAGVCIPLILLLPRMGMGVNGVFYSEPISDVLVCIPCLLAMYFTVYRKLPDTDTPECEVIV